MQQLATVLISALLGFLLVQNVNAADVELSGNVSVSGILNATAVTGDGSGLTNISGTSITNTSVTVNQLAENAVSTEKLFNAAVTPAKISFYQNIAIVALNGGDFNNPATAMSNYQSWCPNLSATNPCLMKIMPGVYDVGSSSVVMQPYIDIEGSGENITKITGSVNRSTPPTSGTVLGASNAEIRFLTVANTGSADNTVAILNLSASPSIMHVTVEASGGVYFSTAIYNVSSSPDIKNVSVAATGTGYNQGIINKDSSPEIIDVTATASGGTYQNCGIENIASSPIMSNVTVTVSAGASNWGIFNSSASSPPMTNITVCSSGGATNNGVKNDASSPVMTNVIAKVSGGTTQNWAVVNTNNSSPVMTNVTATASGASSYGIFNLLSSPTMTNITATGLGPADSFGVMNARGTVKINNSVISGITNGIFNNDGSTTFVGNTQLNGGVANYGTIVCVGAYSGNYAALGANCQ